MAAASALPHWSVLSGPGAVMGSFTTQPHLKRVFQTIKQLQQRLAELKRTLQKELVSGPGSWCVGPVQRTRLSPAQHENDWVGSHMSVCSWCPLEAET